MAGRVCLKRESSQEGLDVEMNLRYGYDDDDDADDQPC